MPNLALDLRYLRFALAAADCGSFRRAAMVLDVSQSTVSRRIQLLEHRLGFVLFRRDRNGARLTAAGAEFMREAAPGIDQLRRAVQLASARHRGEAGDQSIGIPAFLAAGVLHLALKKFRERHPAVRITLREGTTQESLERLAAGRLDIAFVEGEPTLLGHTVEVLWTESIILALPANHDLASRKELTWRELGKETFVVSTQGRGPEIRECLVARLTQLGFQPAIDTHDISQQGLIELVAIGFGITLTSTSALRPSATGVVFKALADTAAPLPVSAVWLTANTSPAIHKLLDTVKGVAQNHASAPR